jgi:hypothetical protein
MRPNKWAQLGLAAALAACAEQADPTAPQSHAAEAALPATSASAAAAELTADAIGRILPALDRDAATPVGNALRTLDAELCDPRATAEARARTVAAVQNVLARFIDTRRADAADLDAMRLEVGDVQASLQR